MPETLDLLFIGDIVGRPGRELIERRLRSLVDHFHPDLVVANVENAAAGRGITRTIAEGLFDAGIDVMTTGNHVWDQREAVTYIGTEPRLIRPANYPPGAPGNGAYLARTHAGHSVGVVNVMGRIFMSVLDDPFVAATREVEALASRARVILVDVHAEATSEKTALGWHLAGQVTAVVGTHTHVQTADDRILEGATAYITDVGMTGPHDSIIGMDKTGVLQKFRTGMPNRFEVASGGPRLNAVVVTADPETGHAVDIQRIDLSADQLADGDFVS